MDSEPKADQSAFWRWWQTLPGVLTALATLVTALTGLFILFSDGPGPLNPPRSPSPGTPPATQPTGAAPTQAPSPTTARPGVEFHFDGGIRQEASGSYVTDSTGALRGVEGSLEGGRIEVIDHDQGKALKFPKPCEDPAPTCPRAVIEVADIQLLNPGTKPFSYGADLLVRPDEATDGANIIQKGFGLPDPTGLWKLELGAGGSRDVSWSPRRPATGIPLTQPPASQTGPGTRSSAFGPPAGFQSGSMDRPGAALLYRRIRSWTALLSHCVLEEIPCSKRPTGSPAPWTTSSSGLSSGTTTAARRSDP